MKKLSLVIIVLFILCIQPSADAYTFAENWTQKDTAYQAAFIAITTADWMQTRWMARQNWQWDGGCHKELNPFLGSHPSIKKIDTLIPLGMVAHTLVSMALPPNYRRIWQCVWIGVESLAIYHNYSVGVKLEF
jgi:hypothetical protein